MSTHTFSKTGLAVVCLYSSLFVFAMWETITACPSFLCDLGTYVITLPWSILLTSTGRNMLLIIIDLPYPPQFGSSAYFVLYTLFFLLNSLILYYFGKLLGYIAGRFRKG